MFIFGKLWIAFLAAGMLVLGLQPVYFAAMANLNRVISHEATWEHVRDAFNAGVLETSYHSRNQYIDSGDRFTDCYSLGVGLEPGVGSAVAGITASRPASDRHACDDLKDAAENPNGVTWNRYARYWHGYRLYSAPLASAFPIVAVKLINLLLLVTQAWPVLIPVLWFETLSRHSQMHAFFVARSAAAALGVIIAAALLAANVTGADLGRSFKLQVPEKRASGT